MVVNSCLKCLVVPSLQHESYLIMNFWNTFDIVLMYVVNELNELKTANLPTLCPQDHTNLDKLQELFPSFEKLGIGRTNIYDHIIIVNHDGLPNKQFPKKVNRVTKKAYPLPNIMEYKVD